MNFTAILDRLDAMISQGAKPSDLKAYIVSVRDQADAAEKEQLQIKEENATLRAEKAEFENSQLGPELKAVLLATHKSKEDDSQIEKMTGFTPDKVRYLLGQLRDVGFVAMSDEAWGGQNHYVTTPGHNFLMEHKLIS